MPTYLSQEKLEELKQELETRKRKTRGEIAELIASAKELGDLSENFEYQEAKEQQALNETRIVQLESIMHDTVIVEKTMGGDTIGLGATFVVKTDDQEKTYSLVGSTEADPMSGKLSHESPIGQAFVGRKPGDEVTVKVPSGSITYKILEIK